jgi:hypothetical protein
MVRQHQMLLRADKQSRLSTVPRPRSCHRVGFGIVFRARLYFKPENEFYHQYKQHVCKGARISTRLSRQLAFTTLFGGLRVHSAPDRSSVQYLFFLVLPVLVCRPPTRHHCDLRRRTLPLVRAIDWGKSSTWNPTDRQLRARPGRNKWHVPRLILPIPRALRTRQQDSAV